MDCGEGVSGRFREPASSQTLLFGVSGPLICVLFSGAGIASWFDELSFFLYIGVSNVS